VFGLDEDGKRFSENVSYSYRKQLQEAEIIVINKLDLVDPEKLAQLREVLGREFPDAEVLEMSARTGAQLHDWFTRAMSGEMAAASVMEIDYKRYGEGEALLGWLNATIHVKAKADPDEFDGNTVLIHLAKALQVSMNERGYEVAHLKATLAPDDAPSEISAVNLVRSDGEPELSHHLVEPIEAGEILLNMRAEAPPEELEAATQRAIRLLIDELSIDFDLHHLQHFRPGQPTPTHRMTTAAN